MVRQLERDRLGQPPGRVDHAEQHVGDRAAAGLPEQPALQDRRNARVPRPGAEHAAVGEHHDRARVGGGNAFDQLQVRGRQVDVVPVGALGLAHAADEHERDVTGLRDRHRLGEQVLVLGRLVLRR